MYIKSSSQCALLSQLLLLNISNKQDNTKFLKKTLDCSVLVKENTTKWTQNTLKYTKQKET